MKADTHSSEGDWGIEPKQLARSASRVMADSRPRPGVRAALIRIRTKWNGFSRCCPPALAHQGRATSCATCAVAGRRSNYPHSQLTNRDDQSEGRAARRAGIGIRNIRRGQTATISCGVKHSEEKSSASDSLECEPIVHAMVRQSPRPRQCLDEMNTGRLPSPARSARRPRAPWRTRACVGRRRSPACRPS